MKKKRVFRIFLVILILVLLVIMYLGFCKAYKYFRYKEFNEITNGEDGIIVEEYCLATFVQPQIYTTRGNMSVSEKTIYDATGKPISKQTADMLIFPKLFGGYDLEITVYDMERNENNGVVSGITFYVSEDLELLETDGTEQFESLGLETDKTLTEYFELYYDKIEAIHRVAGETFKIY